MAQKIYNNDLQKRDNPFAEEDWCIHARRVETTTIANDIEYGFTKPMCLKGHKATEDKCIMHMEWCRGFQTRARADAGMEGRLVNIFKYGWVECCPRCFSRRIHKRKGFHLIAKYRCRKCHSTFREPRGREE